MRGGRLPHLTRTQVAVQTGQTIVQEPTQYPTSSPNHPQQQQTGMYIPRPVHQPISSVPNYSRWELKPNSASFPPADSIFNAESQYDASAEFVRPTSMCIGSVPNKWKFPLGGWFMPFGGTNVPSIRVTAPPRCTRCKAYLNSFFKVEPNGAVGCNICSHRYLPQERIDPTLLANGELMTQGVVDYKVSDPIYMKKDHTQVKILICLEMTKATIENNLFANILESVRASLQAEFDPAVKVGIVVYDQSVHFYKVKSLEREPIEYSVGDSLHALCPLPDSDLFFQVSNQEERGKLEYLLDKLAEKAQTITNPNIITNYYSVLSCLASAFGNHAGRIVLFSMGDPTTVPGKLRPRQKEEIKTPLKPLSQQYVQLSRELVKARVGVDHFIFGRENMYHHQLATTHFLSTSTGGSVFYYTLYNPLINGDHLHFTIYKTLTKEYAYDVDFTCRISNGLSIAKFITADGVHDERDVSLGCFDSNQSVAVIYNHQDKYPLELFRLQECAYVQFAIMFTNGRGERVVRVINHRLQVVDKLELIHQGADYLAVANVLGKLAVNNLIKGDAVKVAQQLLSSITQMLIHYKNERGEIKFAELQVHPHMKGCLSYLHSISSSCLFTNLTKINADRKIDQIIKINSLGFRDFANKFYPKLYCVDLNIYNDEPFPGDYLQNDPEIAILPPSLPLTHSSTKQDSAYLLQDNDFIYLFVMGQASQQLINELFGLNKLDQVNIDTGLPELETGHNIRVANIVAEIRRRNIGLYLPLLVLTPMIKGMYDERIYSLLKEDNKEKSYMFFLKHLHGRVQNGK